MARYKTKKDNTKMNVLLWVLLLWLNAVLVYKIAWMHGTLIKLGTWHTVPDTGLFALFYGAINGAYFYFINKISNINHIGAISIISLYPMFYLFSYIIYFKLAFMIVFSIYLLMSIAYWIFRET